MQLTHLSLLHIKPCCLSCSCVVVNGLAGWYCVKKTLHKHHKLLCNTYHHPLPSLKKGGEQKQRNALFSTPGFMSAFWANLNFDIHHVAVFHGVWIYYETIVVLCCNDDSYIIPSSGGAIWRSGAAVFATVKVTLKGAATLSFSCGVSWRYYLFKEDCHLSYNTMSPYYVDYKFSQGLWAEAIGFFKVAELKQCRLQAKQHCSSVFL